MTLFINFICGILGIIFHLFIKLRSLNKTASAGNIPFSGAVEFLKRDWIEICLSILAVVILASTFTEIVARYPTIQSFARIAFLCCGYFGSSVLLHFFSKSEKVIKSRIDEKTNTMEGLSTDYEFVYEFESNTDKVKIGDSTLALSEFASVKGYDYDGHTIIVANTELEPAALDVIRLDTTTYIARPVRRPK